jgi:hypothetical protein
MYVHILNLNPPLLALPPISMAIGAARLLSDGSKVEFNPSSKRCGVESSSRTQV